MDLTAFTDSELYDHLNAVLDEQNRRQRLAAIPAQVADLAARYVADGGDPAVIQAAVS